LDLASNGVLKLNVIAEFCKYLVENTPFVNLDRMRYVRLSQKIASLYLKNCLKLKIPQENVEDGSPA